MNKKGFTLIELLAVIVILAIIALIAVPIVINIIESNRKRSFVQTGNGIVNAAEYYYMNSVDGKKPTNNTIFEFKDGEIIVPEEAKDKEVQLEFNGEIPKEGTVKISPEGKVELVASNENYCLTKGFDDKEVTIKDYDGSCTLSSLGCKVIKGNGNNVGDEISCAGEEFYVVEISQDKQTISMLAKYNLNVGDNPYLNGTIGIQNENVLGEGDVGTVQFSTRNYWSYEEEDPETFNMILKYLPQYSNRFIYDSNSLLYEYVENYEKYLISKGVSSAEGTLLSMRQLESLGCDESKWTCGPDNMEGELDPYAPDWVYSIEYWIGTGVYVVEIDGYLGSAHGCYLYNYCDIPYKGVRPVINISVSELN